MVNLDRRRILQAMMNLVSNSSKFSRDDSVILLESRIEAHDLKIFVADPGIGMSKEKLRQLFDLDLVQDAAANGNGGTGLGLRIVKDIVESHGGRIYIQSQPGQGTRVSIVLPIGEDEE
ncbi:MAG: ATP-binding protein, partial [Dehalococcoidia bacterium]